MVTPQVSPNLRYNLFEEETTVRVPHSPVVERREAGSQNCPRGYVYDYIDGVCRPPMKFTHEDSLNTIDEDARNIFETFEVGAKEANERAAQDIEEPFDEWRILNWPVADIVAENHEMNMKKLGKLNDTMDTQNVGMISGNYITPSRTRNPKFMTALMKSLKRLDYEEITLQYQSDNPTADTKIKIPKEMRAFIHEVFSYLENEVKLYEESIKELRQYETLYNKKKRWISLDRIAQIYQMGQILTAIENNKMTKELMSGTAFNEFCNYMANGDIEALRANVNACNLIHDWLDRDEWIHLVEKREVVIKSKKYSNRYYLIKENAYDRVIVIENGKSTKELCGVVTEKDPDTYIQLVNGDQLLTKIITLKTDEKHYLANSNESPGDERIYPEYKLGKLRLRLGKKKYDGLE